MIELNNIPDSLRNQITNAQNLLAQSEQAQRSGNSDLAVVRAREGLKVLPQIARQNPEMGALLVAAEYGYQGIEVAEREEIKDYVLIDRKFLGMTTGTDVVQVDKSQVHWRTVRLI